MRHLLPTLGFTSAAPSTSPTVSPASPTTVWRDKGGRICLWQQKNSYLCWILSTHKPQTLNNETSVIYPRRYRHKLRRSSSSIAAPAAAKKDEFARKLHTFNAIVKELQSGYVSIPLDANSIMDKTIGALLYQIDPYTRVLPGGRPGRDIVAIAGQYAGIGSVIQKRGNKVIISEPQWSRPRSKAGLRPGDVIIAADADTVTAATDISAVSRRLRGQAGTEVRVDVCRPYVEDSMLSFNITRADIKVNPLPTTAYAP